jgi:hypothetical protein
MDGPAGGMIFAGQALQPIALHLPILRPVGVPFGAGPRSLRRFTPGVLENFGLVGIIRRNNADGNEKGEGDDETHAESL